jgi:hypothetical protein
MIRAHRQTNDTPEHCQRGTEREIVNFALEGNIKEEGQTQRESEAESLGRDNMAEPVSFVLGEAEDETSEELETGDSFPGDKQPNQQQQQQQQQHVNGLVERRKRLR